MKKSLCSILFLFLVAFVCSVNAQTISQARNWYLEGSYQKALPVFKKLLLNKPNDPSLNLWYGACLVETGKFKEAISYLDLAQKKLIPDAQYYLAKYFYLCNLPDTALTHIDQFLAQPALKASTKNAAIDLKFTLEGMVANLKLVEDVTIIDSVIVLKSALYNTLKLSENVGKMLPVKEMFEDSPKANGSVYLPERDDRALYANSHSGSGLDLVVRHRLISEWDSEEPLSDVLNTEWDELNPWMLTDGTTLYFASNRPGGLGGYDLYLTRMKKDGTFLLPNHLNMPYNSSANDYFLVIDEFTNRGYLATDRNQAKGYAVIYTFIPNTTTRLVEGKSLKALQDLAAIKSIRATWEGKNMDSLRAQPQVPLLSQNNEDAGLDFVINDQLTYDSADDFISAEARNLFKQYVKEHIRYVSTSEKLLELRATYLASEPSVQNELRSEILKLEAAAIDLKKTLPTLEKNIRNIELLARTK